MDPLAGHVAESPSMPAQAHWLSIFTCIFIYTMMLYALYAHIYIYIHKTNHPYLSMRPSLSIYIYLEIHLYTWINLCDHKWSKHICLPICCIDLIYIYQTCPNICANLSMCIFAHHQIIYLPSLYPQDAVTAQSGPEAEAPDMDLSTAETLQAWPSGIAAGLLVFDINIYI